MRLNIDKEAYFPNLRADLYRVTSLETSVYNCIAHAAGTNDQWWWPEDFEGVTWPDGIPKEETVASFVAAYLTRGYLPCEGPSLEAGFEKIALYVNPDGVPTHAARQLSSGAWTSKLGEWEDIEHLTLEALEDPHGIGLAYGKVALILRRQRASGDISERVVNSPISST